MGRRFNHDRRERFARLVAGGMDQGAALMEAAWAEGVELDPQGAAVTASQIMREPGVRDRIAELRRAAADAVIASIILPAVETVEDAHAVMGELTAAFSEAIDLAAAAGLDGGDIDRARRALGRHTARVEHKVVRGAADAARRQAPASAGRVDPLDAMAARCAALVSGIVCRCPP
jgi:hypothetical protein